MLFLVMWVWLKLLVFVLSVYLSICQSVHTSKWGGGHYIMENFGCLQRVAKIFYYVVTPTPVLLVMEKLRLGFARPKNFEGIIDCCWTGKYQKMRNSSENWWVEWGFLNYGMYAEIYYILATNREVIEIRPDSKPEYIW